MDFLTHPIKLSVKRNFMILKVKWSVQTYSSLPPYKNRDTVPPLQILGFLVRISNLRSNNCTQRYFFFRFNSATPNCTHPFLHCEIYSLTLNKHSLSKSESLKNIFSFPVALCHTLHQNNLRLKGV